MKVFISILLLIASCFSFATDTISGSKSAYQYDSSQKMTAVPEGYSPFYINHIGRHGSRYISKPKYGVITHQVLQLAKQQNQLTSAGENLLTQMDKIAILNKGNYGALTDLGKRDIEKIAQRMLNRFPVVFQGNHIEILSTTSPRAIASAKAFSQPFTSLYTNLEVKQQPDNAEVLLRFFEYSPTYTEYKESKAVKDLVKSLEKSEHTEQVIRNVANKIWVLGS